MNRIRKFYDRRFRVLAGKLGISFDELIHDLFGLAGSADDWHSQKDFVLAAAHADLRRKTNETASFPRNFICDGGLGGLARWLRAAGYGAAWRPELDDPGLIREAVHSHATLITTDTMIMERGVLRDGLCPSVCVPPSLSCEDHLKILFRELNLGLMSPRCMNCGGPLVEASKDAVIERVPPKTALWLDNYFNCARCEKLFWHGSHWQRIAQKLQQLPVPEK